MQTCRFCKKSEHDAAGRQTMVKYGVRHYAHHDCYLDSGRTLDALSAWQVGRFPYRLLKERGLLAEAERIAKSAAEKCPA